MFWRLKQHYLFITSSTVCSTKFYILLLSDPYSASMNLFCIYFRLFRVTYVTGKHCIVAINKYKGKFHLIIYFKIAVVFIVLISASSSCCSLLYFFIFFVSNNQILHFVSIHSHWILAINEHKGKWVIVLTNKTTQFFHHTE